MVNMNHFQWKGGFLKEPSKNRSILAQIDKQTGGMIVL